MALEDFLDLFNVTSPSLFLKVVAAIVILLAGIIVGRLLAKLVQKVLHELELDKSLLKYGDLSIPLERWIASVVAFVVYVFAVVWALRIVGLAGTFWRVLLGSILVGLCVVVLFWLHSAIPRFFSGLRIRREKIVTVGDRIALDAVQGTVVRVGLFETVLESRRGEKIFVPNTLLAKNAVVRK